MPHTFVFVPKQARLAPWDGKVEKINPYCKFKIGMYSAKTKAAMHEGENPHWNEIIAVYRKHNEEFCQLKVKDRHRLSPRAFVGKVKIPLDNIMEKQKILEWFPLTSHEKVVGEIEMECRYIGDIQKTDDLAMITANV